MFHRAGEGEQVRLGLSWTDAISVVLSAIGVYLAFLILIRIVGQRALAAMSSFDFAATIAVGAIMGRAVLGYTPTLGAGVLGMATLFALQSAFGRVRWNRRLDRTPERASAAAGGQRCRAARQPTQGQDLRR